MKKTLLIKLLFLLAVFTANAQTWNIGYPIAADVTATLRNDTLIIKGNGEMRDWNSSLLVPWNARGVKYIEIIEGVTNIGTLGFCGSTVPGPVAIHLPESMITINGGAFFGSDITSIVIPKAVTKIQYQAFDGCTSLTSITNLNPIPQNIPASVFTGVNLSAVTLTVPCGSLTAYQNAPVWQDFGTIVEDCTPQAGISNVKANFSCPGQVTVTYDLGTTHPTDVTLYYSPDNGKTWLTAQTISGDLIAQSTGAGKTIIWDNRADNVKWGKFKLKVEVPKPKLTYGTVKSSLPVGELTFLCYNLGADPAMTIEEQMAYTSVGSTDATVYGDLYQWGRNTDGHEKRTSGTTATLSATDVPGHGLFITTNSGDYNWRTTRVDNLWSKPKTANDPCPAGYRIPTTEEWESIFAGASGNTWTWTNTGTQGFKISPNGGANYTLFLPQVSVRPCWTTGFFAGASYWSSTVAISEANLLTMSNPNNVQISGGMRANGYPVRCIKEY